MDDYIGEGSDGPSHASPIDPHLSVNRSAAHASNPWTNLPLSPPRVPKARRDGITEGDVVMEMGETGLPRQAAIKSLKARREAENTKPKKMTKDLKAVASNLKDVNTQSTAASSTSPRGKLGKKLGQTKGNETPTIVETESFVFDIEATAEEQENKGRYINRLSTMIDELDRMAFSPRIALDALKELMTAAPRRRLQMQVEKLGEYGYIIQARTIAEAVDDVMQPSDDQTFNDVQVLSERSYEEVRRLVIHGYQPILERTMAGPSQYSSYRNWLRNAAATLAVQNDPDYFIHLPSPKILIDPNTNEISIKLQVNGFDPVEEKTWRSVRTIPCDTIPDVNLPEHPLHVRVKWSEPSLSDVGEEVGQATMLTNEYKFARIITAAFDGYCGSSISVRREIDTMITRYACRSAYARESFSRLATTDLPFPIENIIPWEPAASWKKGKILIVVKKEIREATFLKRFTVTITVTDLEVLLEVFDSMLIRLITGSDLITIFESAMKTVDSFAVDETDESDIHNNGTSTSKICEAGDRADHWHTCAGCLLGFPCNRFPDRSMVPMLCNGCAESNKPAGWKLAELMGTSDPLLLERATSLVRRQLSILMRADLYHMGLSTDQSLSEIEEAWANLVRFFGAEGPRKWHDLYIKDAVLDEDVARNLGWDGKLYSPHAPSVESVRSIFVKDGILHNHCDGNVAVTSVSINRVLGSNVKVALKAIHQLLVATTEQEERSAVHHILIHCVIRVERTLNARLRSMEGKRPLQLGLATTPYLEALSRASFEGELSIPRYVPNEVVFSPLAAQQGWQPQQPAMWRPENYDNYLQPQIESVAKRYGLDGADQRHLWTLNDATTGFCEVPFIFSKLSRLEIWTWHTWFMWCCQRLERLKKECDNHLLAAYQDDPEAREKLNVETFMLTLLHLFMSMIVANRNHPRQYAGQRIRALDAGGFEQLANVRNPLSISIAHSEHGAAMVTGYDGSTAFPTQHDEESFVHARCNIRIESWLVNVARQSSNEVAVLDSAIDQFRNVRLDEQDFLPNAPRPYTEGKLTHYDQVQFSSLINQPIAAADQDFCFTRFRRKGLAYLIPPARVPELHEGGKANKSHAGPTGSEIESDNDSEEDGTVGTATRAEMPNKKTQFSDNMGFVQKSSSTHQSTAAKKSQTKVAPSRQSIPRAANLGHDVSSCFVAAPVQILHKVFPLRRHTVNARITPERRTHLLNTLGLDAVKIYSDALHETHATFQSLEYHADTGQQVSEKQTASFRDAYNVLSKGEGSHDPQGDWRHREADATDFLCFVLKYLSIFSHSGKSDERLLRDVVGQTHFLEPGEVVPAQVNALDVRRIYTRNMNDSGLHACYIVQSIFEEQCNNISCEAIARKHEFAPTIRLEMTRKMASNSKEVPLEDLQWNFSRGTQDPTACRRCERCQIGRMTEWCQRVVTLPDNLMMSVQRVIGYKDGRAVIAPNRIASRDSLSLSPYYLTGKLFSEHDEPMDTAVSYELLGMIMYRDEDRHYIAFVRETADHDGGWICYNDLEKQPKYAPPFSPEYDDYVEALLVYRKRDIFSNCETCVQLRKTCFHNSRGKVDPERCYHWLEHARVRNTQRHTTGLSEDEMDEIKIAAEKFEDLMEFEKLTQFAPFGSQKRLASPINLVDSDLMEYNTEEDLPSEGVQVDTFGESPQSTGTAVYKPLSETSPPPLSSSSIPIRTRRRFVSINQRGESASVADQDEDIITVLKDSQQKREKWLLESTQKLNLEKDKLERDVKEHAARTLDLIKRETNLTKKEDDLVNREKLIREQKETLIHRERLLKKQDEDYVKREEIQSQQKKELVDREEALKKQEEDLAKRQHQFSTSTEPALTRLHTIIGEIRDDEVPAAYDMMSQIQSRWMKFFLSSMKQSGLATTQESGSREIPAAQPTSQASTSRTPPEQPHGPQMRAAAGQESRLIEASTSRRQILGSDLQTPSVPPFRSQLQDVTGQETGSSDAPATPTSLKPALFKTPTATLSQPRVENVFERPDPPVTETSPFKSALKRSNSQDTIKSVRFGGEGELKGDEGDTSDQRSVHDEGDDIVPDSESRKRYRRAGTPEPFSGSPIHKKSKAEGGLTRSDSQQSMRPTSHRSESRMTLKTPTLAPSKSIQDLRGAASAQPTLRHSPSRGSLNPTTGPSSIRGSKRGIGRTITKTRDRISSVFAKKREDPRTLPARTTPQASIIQQIIDSRMENGEPQYLVRRAGFNPGWEPAVTVMQEAGALAQQYLASKRVDSPEGEHEDSQL